jgi:hypothetical protein
MYALHMKSTEAKRLAQIDKEIESIKAQLQTIRIVRPGSLTKQYRNPDSQRGGYYQLSYTHRMKSRTAYVRAPFLREVRQQIRSYKRLKKLFERWVALGIEHSQLSMKSKQR